MTLVERLLASPGIEDVVVSYPDDAEAWREVRGTYLHAPFVYRVSADDDAEAARSVFAKIISEWDSGELKPSEEAHA